MYKMFNSILNFLFRFQNIAAGNDWIDPVACEVTHVRYDCLTPTLSSFIRKV